MDADELKLRLQGFEWSDCEFKEARREAPKAAYETVAAFSNTAGGWLIFGIKETSHHHEVVGVIDVDRVQNDFLSTLRSGQKLSIAISAQEHLIPMDGKVVLAFYIPEALRQEKPVYLNGDIRQSFVRRGGCDERCSQEDIKRFLRDASEDRYDGQSVELDPETCFDPTSLSWYRRLFYQNNPNHDQTLSDLEFLCYFGWVKETRDGLLVTRASVLLFGTESSVMQLLPRPTVDCRWIDAEWNGTLPEPERRWLDRLLIEANLVQAWQRLADGYMRHSERPFSIDSQSLRRQDVPPDYVTFREAAINLLMHQDYSDENRTPVIQFFRDRTVLSNPGEAFATREELLEPGMKDTRNPKIVSAFRRIGLSEQAGTGIRSIFQNWRQMGRVPPVIENDKARNSFGLSLLKEELLSEEQLLFQASLGVHLAPDEAATFALACRKGRLQFVDVKAVTGFSEQRAYDVIEKLRVQALLQCIEAEPHPYYVVMAHLRDRFSNREALTDEGAADTDLVSDQPPRIGERLVSDQPDPLKSLSPSQWAIVDLCDVPHSLGSIMDGIGVTNRTYFRQKHLDALLKGGILRMTHPERPNHPGQAYVLTDAGVELKTRRLNAASDRNGGENQ